MAAHAGQHDAAMACCLTTLLGLVDALLPVEPASAAGLLCALGALACGQPPVIIHWASWLDTLLPLIQRRDPGVADRLPDAFHAHAAGRVPTILACVKAANESTCLHGTTPSQATLASALARTSRPSSPSPCAGGNAQ